MSSEKTPPQMTIETMQLKISNQKNFIDQLTEENEELFHQFNHLMIRNTKLLKRVDDLQNIIDDLHLRIEELQLINSNQLHLNDNLRRRTDYAIGKGSDAYAGRGQAYSAGSSGMKYFNTLETVSDPAYQFDLDQLFEKWRNYPGQEASNAPNLRKQVLMMLHLYNTKKLRAAELFNLSGVGGVTGARYVATLKKMGLITYTGARKKGHYEITEKGKAFIDSGDIESSGGTEEKESANEEANKRGIQAKYHIPGPRKSAMNRDDL
ncbi:MAG TPA: hypothetical protein PKM97_09635 [Bacteroidia bacterium]|nr:hypothetical protein [Bacteroidia bacterium]